MTPILITSTAEGTGKTAIALALARLAHDRGHDVGYMKPKGTRLRSAVGKTLDSDPLLATELLDLPEGVGDLEPVVYSRTFIEGALRGQESVAALHERVREAYDGIAAEHGFVVVEGGGSFSTGGVVELTDADVADLLDARVVLVAPYGEPVDVDPVFAAQRHFGDRLDGVVFNAVTDAALDELSADVVPFIEGRGLTVYGTLPHRRELAGVTVDELSAELGATVLTTDAPTDAFVERFTVGAMGADDALRHFRRTRDAVMVTGGDRSDVQLAALEAPGIRALVLTGGYRPSDAVLGRAEDAGVPVLSVRTDTTTAVDRLEDVIQSGRTRDEWTVEVMEELLSGHADVDALLALADA